MFFGHSHWETPAAILRSVFTPHSQTAVKACHASSKTFTAADAIALALLAGGDVLTTAPTWEQVKTVLWGALHRTLYDLQKRHGVANWSINQTDIKTASGALALGLSTNEGVRFQGFHARPDSFLLVIFDEAPGVMPDIYDAVAGISAGGDVRKLYIGNPVIASGPFFDIYAGDVPGWGRYTIDAFDTPNLHGLTLAELLALPEHELDRNVRPYLVDRRWVRDRYYEWGEDHPLWESRVRGRFPLQAEDALISLAWLEQAKLRPAAFDKHAPIRAGIDVAGPGEDETVLCVRQGPKVLELQGWAQADARGSCLATLNEWRERGSVERVAVDVAGIGHYFATHIEDAGYRVERVNVGESPTSDAAAEKYRNLKAEVYWSLRDRLRDGAFAGLTDQRTIAQLAGIRYQHDSRGRVEIEKKEDARKRGVKSPDRAEAVALAFWEDPRAEYAGIIGQRAAMAGYGTPPEPSPYGRLRDEMDDRRPVGVRRTV